MLGLSDGGDHTLRMEYTIGAVSEVLEKTNTLGAAAQRGVPRILVFLGNTPDPNRDYQLDVLLPDLMGDFQKNLDLVVEIKEELLAVTAEKGEDYAQFDELDRQIRRFMADYDKIPAQFDTFRHQYQQPFRVAADGAGAAHPDRLF